MKDKIYLLFTAGRGPVECGIAVQGIQNRFKQFLIKHKIAYKITNQKQGMISRSMETIVFEIDHAYEAKLTPWIGTIKWICQSPVRKFHKRKNWFIKCESIMISSKIELDIKDVKCQAYRASGPGGQHRNKVETAIRLIHSTSGIIVTASDGKSKHQNKKKAWEKLKSKLKERNQLSINHQNLDKWATKIEIERGKAVKVFEGLKFMEQ